MIPAAHHSVSSYAAELPLPVLVWGVGTVLMESERNRSFCREDSFQREGDRNEPWEGAWKAVLLRHPESITGTQKTSNSWLPCHLQQLQKSRDRKNPFEVIKD